MDIERAIPVNRGEDIKTGKLPEERRVKYFFKRFFWIPLIFLSAIIIIVLSVNKGNKNEFRTDKKSKGQQEYSNEPRYNERVIKTFTPKSGAAFKYNFPTIVGDYIYLGTSTKISYAGTDREAIVAALPSENYFYKMDLDLKPVWAYQMGRIMVIGGASLDSKGNIYFVTESVAGNNKANSPGNEDFFLSTVYLTSLTADGKLRWQKTISSENDLLDHSMLNVAIGTDDVIYVGHDKFYAISPDGNLKWQYPEDKLVIKGFSSSPIIDKAGNIYFASPQLVANGQPLHLNEIIYLYKFKPEGDLVWKTLLGNELRPGEGPVKTGGEPVSSGMQKVKEVKSIPAFTMEEKFIYALIGCTVNKVNTDTGKISWSMNPQSCTGGFIASPAVDNEDSLFIGTKSNTDSRFYAISSEGNVIWENHVGADMYDSPVLGDDDSVYISSELLPEGKFFAFDRKTGATKWKIGRDRVERTIADPSFGSMSLHKGHIYMGVYSTNDGGNNNEAFFKIKVDAYGYLKGSPWPCLHGSNANTGRSE